MTRKEYINKLIITTLCIVYPVYALPFLLILSLKNDKYYYFLISLVMGYFAYLLVPYTTMDITRYYATYNELLDKPYDNVFLVGRYIDVVFYSFFWMLGKIGLNKQFIPFFAMFFCYYFYLNTLRKIINHTPLDIHRKLLILGLFLLFGVTNFIDDSSGSRNPLAFSIIIYAIISFYYDKKIIPFLFLSFFSIILHVSSALIFIIFIFASLTYRISKEYRVLFIISFFLLLLGFFNEFFFYIIDLFKPTLIKLHLYFPSYMTKDGVWGPGFYDNKNIKTYVFEKFIMPLPFYISALYFVFIHRFVNKKLSVFLMILFIFISLFSVSRTMFARYNHFFATFFVFYFIAEIGYTKLTKIRKVILVLFIFSIGLSSFGYGVKYRQDYLHSWGKVFYEPALFTLFHEITPKDYIVNKSL